MSKENVSSAKTVYEELYKRMSDGLDGLSEVDQALTEEMLKEYAWLCANIFILREEIDKAGAIIEVEKGNNSYRHKEKVENPAIKTLVRFQTQKSAYYTKLHKVVNVDDVDTDELGSWFKKNG